MYITVLFFPSACSKVYLLGTFFFFFVLEVLEGVAPFMGSHMPLICGTILGQRPNNVYTHRLPTVQMYVNCQIMCVRVWVVAGGGHTLPTAVITWYKLVHLGNGFFFFC